jgi:aspartate/methionine/tyrosine aminotransferase
MRNRIGVIYWRTRELSPSVTPETAARTWAMRLASEGVIGFGAGQLLFVLPEHVVEAAGRAVTEPGTHRCGPAFDRGSKEDTP